MSNAWSHLPNADHIDWVLKSLNENPELWDAAKSAAWSAVRVAARDVAWAAVRVAVMSAAWDAVRVSAWDAAWDPASAAAWDPASAAAWDPASAAGRVAARGVISALIAYDDCDQFLSMSYKRLKVWAVLSEDSRAVLLLPMVNVKEQLALLATV